MLKVLVLNGEDVKPLFDMREVLDVVEQAFREKGLGRVQMPPKIYLFYKKYNGDLRVMPSYIENIETSAVKIVNSHPNNSQYGLPTVMATIVLVEPKTGRPLTIMDGTWITAMRTGAATGVATKHLCRKDSEKLGLIGAGVQATTQLMAMACIMKLKEVRVWSREEERAKTLIQKMSRQYPDIEFFITETPQKAVEEADIVVTATPSRLPILKDGWIKSGTHINAIGADAPGKQEVDPKILKKAKIVVDDWEQACHGGEINVPLAEGIISEKEIYGELGEIVVGKKTGRVSDEEITVFVSTGLAVQDAVTAKLVYDKAVKRGLGIYIDFIST